MNEGELFSYYEKIYFHEQSRKELIFSRLSIPLAVMVAIAGFYAVIIAGDYKKLPLGEQIWFWVILVLSLVALISGAVFFVNALLGRMDQVAATPNELEAWRQNLLKYYEDEPDGENIAGLQVRRALYVDFMNCGSIMSLNNDAKVVSLYRCNISLIASTALAGVAFAVEKIPSL